jgi:hypothetical protein
LDRLLGTVEEEFPVILEWYPPEVKDLHQYQKVEAQPIEVAQKEEECCDHQQISTS